MTEDNPIVAEIREIREQMLAEYGGDMSAYLADARRRTAELVKAGRVLVREEKGTSKISEKSQ